MRVIARKPLREFWESRADAEGALRAWWSEVKAADWKTPADVKRTYGSASIVGNGRVVFNICGNKYRLVVRVNYGCGIVYVRFIGTHREYDRINAEEI